MWGVPYHSVFTVSDKEVVPDGNGWSDEVNAEGREIESGGTIFNDAVNSWSTIHGRRRQPQSLSNMLRSNDIGRE
jgi:hypothetical protein